MYQKLGLVDPWVQDGDLGRFEATGNEADKQFFKVPSLRNVAKTGPWFHDGSIPDLAEAIRLMGKHQLGVDLSPDQVASIVAFLGSLTGEVDQVYIEQPRLPGSGPDTPAPDPS